MNGEPRVMLRRSVAALIAVALLLTGAGVAYLLTRAATNSRHNMPEMQGAGGTTGDRATPGSRAPGAAATGASSMADAPLPDVTVTLTEDAVERAGIVVTPVSSGTAGSALRLAGVVEPNAYRRVDVTPIVGGRVTRVLVELGEQVRRGQTVAEVYSPELADAQTEYLSFVAELDAAHQQLRRTERLVEIGAASRQELEKVRAEHTTHASHVEGARSRLVLLGMAPASIKQLSSANEITATTRVPAPINGIITERIANAGLNVDPSTKLFTVVDLSTVWVVGDLYEKDFGRVRIGSPATVTTTAYPDLALAGRVSYIDPQVSPETRTARVRVEVGNPRAGLRLGMYAEVQIRESGAGRVPIVPRNAVQNVGDRHVVYLVNPKERGRFIEREIRLGEVSGDEIEVVSGLQPGDVVVAEGSFYLRAERERLGLRQMAGAASRTDVASTPTPSETTGVQTAQVTVSDQGYEPSKLSLRADVPARITFIRTSDKTCGTEVVFPSLNLRRELPLDQPVVIEFTPPKTGEVAFVCGMNMLRGAVVVH
jgi:cobalt-zinc-cadmium efflux system membrane fusion protein